MLTESFIESLFAINDKGWDLRDTDAQLTSGQLQLGIIIGWHNLLNCKLKAPTSTSVC